MSAAASTTKPPTANSLLYKMAKDVKRLPFVTPTDYGAEEKNALMKGYWAVYDKEYEDLEGLWLSLFRKEKAEAEKWKSEEEKKKKKEKKKKTAVPTLPVASGSRKSKGKEKEEIEVIDSDSESETDMEFRETCIGCKRAKLKCVFNYNSFSKKSACDWELQSVRRAVAAISGNMEVRNQLQAESFYHQYNLQVISRLQWSLNALSTVDGQDIRLRTLENQLAEASSMPKELQDAMVHGWSHVIEHYNIVQMCGAQMKSIAVQYRLGKGFGSQFPLLNRYGEMDFSGEVDFGVKRRRPQDEDTESSPSKKPRMDKGMVPEEVETEKEKGLKVVPNVDKGKGKEKEPGSEEDVEETMKE
ncbi:hypothetical protein M422DRAFT_249308 [Sphaerobolus stellatus SS14]|uniref:Uncharacterized protein n=1 Tax=Sphaerobolus stellatus (strain SS14) TaxID=990650 RepID=A0A0C9UVD9_SPHS4|nr:hypothetical protein M422DRAFT_249308 [Sphaerobolus stellatus SS14]